MKCYVVMFNFQLSTFILASTHKRVTLCGHVTSNRWNEVVLWVIVVIWWLERFLDRVFGICEGMRCVNELVGAPGDCIVNFQKWFFVLRVFLVDNSEFFDGCWIVLDVFLKWKEINGYNWSNMNCYGCIKWIICLYFKNFD